MEIYKKIILDRQGNEHLYIQLYKFIKNMIINGEINPHEKLPPIRKLSKILGINNVTIVKAYDMLEAEDYVYKKIGSGTFVSEIGNIKYDEREDIYADISLMDRGHIQINENMINFASATPTPELFPIEDFKGVLNEVLDRDGGYAFEYQESKGYYPLRQSIVDYLKLNNINTFTDNIQIISGAQQGIDIISKALLTHRDTVIVESPTYTGAIATFRSRGVNIIEIPINQGSLDFELLEKCIIEYKPKLIYTMPNFQNPTGYSYNISSKKRLLDIANKNDILIIEDDYLRDLNFYTNENTTLKSLDRNEKVIYIKSFSKIFMPGLRLGFLVTPLSLNKDILMAKHTSDISTSGLIQRAFDLYLRKGIWKKHITLMKNIYKERFDVMVNSIDSYFPEEIIFKKPMGGINFWINLTQQININDLYSQCIDNNIVFVPGNVFYPSNNIDVNYIRLSIAAVYKEEIQKGIKTLGQLIYNYMGKNNTKINNKNYYRPIL